MHIITFDPIECNLFAGQKVVMMHDEGCPPERTHLHPTGYPLYGCVYTIREVYTDITTAGAHGVFLQEFKGAVVMTLYGMREIGYCALMFKPAVDKPADISVFKKMLTPKTKENA